MIIQLDSLIREAKTVDDLKPILLIMVKALNTTDDAKNQVVNDLVLKNGGLIMRCDDNSYKRMNIVMSNGYPAIQIENVGTDPKARVIS